MNAGPTPSRTVLRTHSSCHSETPGVTRRHAPSQRLRLDRIRRLSKDHLRSYELADNTLTLHYDRRVAREVEEAAALERESCAVLAFHVSRHDDDVELTIVGPSLEG